MPFPSIEELIAQLEARKRAIQAGGGPERVQKQHEAGKLTARERMAKLFDRTRSPSWTCS
jgi:acetyl-CoA carboxylase carboxyltransferase component